MKKYYTLLLLIFLAFSCKKETVLETTFNCSTNSIPNSERINDFKGNFSIKLPKNWKKELFYSSNQSEIFSADTTKQLSETYIIKISNNLGELKYDTSFFNKIEIANKLQQQVLIESQIEQFLEKEMYWNVYKGSKKGFTFHQFNSYIKTSNNSFINTVIEIYGDENINERLCKAIKTLKTLKF